MVQRLDRRGVRGPAAAAALVTALPAAIAAAQGATPFPAEVVAPVEWEGPEGSLAITSLYVERVEDGDRPVVVLQLAEAASTLPDGVRIAVITGDPNGAQERTSLVSFQGELAGAVEQGDGEIWSRIGTSDVSFGPDGAARIMLDEIRGAAVWAQTVQPDGTVFRTPVFPTSVLGVGKPGQLSTATSGSVLNQARAPTGRVVATGAGPTLELVDGDLVLRATAAPESISGEQVTETRDFLRVVPDYSDGGRSPYFVSVDVASGAVTYWDGSPGLPVAVQAEPESWLVTPLSDEGDGYTITFDPEGLLEAIGATGASEAGFGVARSLTLANGEVVTSEGPVATVGWLSAAAPVQDSTTTTPPATASGLAGSLVATTAATSATGGDSSSSLLVAGAVAAAVLLGGLAFWAARRFRQRDEITPALVDAGREPGTRSGSGSADDVWTVSRSPAGRADGDGDGNWPEEVIEALNRLIDDLPLPGERD